MPNFIEIKETFCGRTNVGTEGRKFETGFIRSTLSKSRPKMQKYDAGLCRSKRLKPFGCHWRSLHSQIMLWRLFWCGGIHQQSGKSA